MLTLGTARPILWSYVSNVPFSTATDEQIAAFDATLNRLCERLILEGKWRGTFRQVVLATHGSFLTLPRNLQVCLGLDPVTSSVVGMPLNISSRWYPFSADGRAFTSAAANCCSIRNPFPVSDDAQTFTDPTGTFYLRAKSTSPDGSGFTFVGGVDENGAALPGHIRLAVANGSTTTTQQFTEMPFIEKSVTRDPVSLYSVDVITTEETLLCIYAPSETIPAYRRYLIPSASDGDTFLCLCKLAFVPAIVDSDPIIPSVTDALILGLQSFQFRDKADAERSAQYMGPNYDETTGRTSPNVMAGAIDVLETDRDELDSGERLTLNIGMDFGAGNICNVR